MFVASAGRRVGSLEPATARHDPQWTWMEPQTYVVRPLRDGLPLCGRAQTATNEPLATRKLLVRWPAKALLRR